MYYRSWPLSTSSKAPEQALHFCKHFEAHGGREPPPLSFWTTVIINNGGEVSISTAGPQYPRLIAYYGNGNICLNRPLYPGEWTHFLHGLVIVQRYVRRRSINRQFNKIITAQLRSIMVFNPLLLKTFMSGALHSHGWLCGLPWEIIEMITRLCINGRLERGQDLPIRRIQTKSSRSFSESKRNSSSLRDLFKRNDQIPRDTLPNGLMSAFS